MPTNIPIMKIGTNLIVPVPGELNDQLIQQLQSEILGRLEVTTAQGLLLDISALTFVDSFLARILCDIASMANLMGAHTVLVGMSPVVAMVLMELGLDLGRIRTARDLERGIQLLADLAAAGDAGLSDVS